MSSVRSRLGALAAACVVTSAAAAPVSPPSSRGLALPIRGVTIGPIENTVHPGLGYGSEAYGRALDEARKMGATWVALTPFGRVYGLSSRGIDLTFERPFEDNRKDIARAIDMAHARGLSVMLVPHLWTETHEWRALIDPGSDEGWVEWERNYTSFVRSWAEVAEATHVDLFSCGVELRSWVTSGRAPGFSRVIREVRKTYRGPITYSANWDDVDDTVILGELDVIGINAFYPLAEKDDESLTTPAKKKEGASLKTLLEGGKRVADRVRRLAEVWHKSILFTEVGYTNRADPAVEPWLWPDDMKDVRVDQRAQAKAYSALIAPHLDEAAFAGFFVWRTYSDPDDVSQEAEYGFSPRGKLAELVLRDAFGARWLTDRDRLWSHAPRALVPGVYP